MMAALAFLQGALAFLMSPIGRLIGVGVISLSVGLWQGWSIRDKLCDRAELRSQLAAQQRDLGIQKAATEFAKRQAAALERTAGDLQQKVEAYEAERDKVKGDRCRLTGDDVKRLRNIR